MVPKRRSGSRLALIVMDDVTEYLAPPDRPTTRPTRQRDRALLPQALMWASFIIERDILS
jgi:hypothetical protein